MCIAYAVCYYIVHGMLMYFVRKHLVNYIHKAQSLLNKDNISYFYTMTGVVFKFQYFLSLAVH